MRTKLLMWLMLPVILASCSNGGGSSASDYVSVRIDDSKMWSLLDVKSGEMQFQDEFFAPATNVVKGAFFVETKDKRFDLYNIKDTKNKLNRDSYTFVSNFNKNGFAIVRVNTEPWQIVDTKGTVVATVDKTLNIVSGFADNGLASFINKDGMFGYINESGAEVIKPRYKSARAFFDNLAIVMTKYEDGKSYFEVINGAGETQFKFNSGQYSEMTDFNQGHAFAIEGDHISLLDSNGKKIQNVGKGYSLNGLSYSDGKFIYSDGEFYGVKDLEGKILIRAKYPYLEFIGANALRARNTNDKFGVVDIDDEIIVPFEYSSLDYVAPDRYFTTSGSVIVLIDKNGKEMCNSAFAQVVNRSESADGAQLTAIISSISNLNLDAFQTNTNDLSSMLSMSSKYKEMLSQTFQTDGFDDAGITDFMSDSDSSYNSSDSDASTASATIMLNGTVGKYPIEMTLKNTPSGTATGSYAYTKSGNGQKIAISGNYYGNDTLVYTLTEYYDGEPSGEWEFTVEISGGSATANGTMVNAKGKNFTITMTGNVM